MYGHEAVELFGGDHFPEAEDLLINGALASFARRSSRLGILSFPWLRRVRHFQSQERSATAKDKVVRLSLFVYSRCGMKEEENGSESSEILRE